MPPTHDRLVSPGTALAKLGDALAQPKTEWTRDSAIQRLEFTFELAWKAVANVRQRQKGRRVRRRASHGR